MPLAFGLYEGLRPKYVRIHSSVVGALFLNLSYTILLMSSRLHMKKKYNN